MRITRRTRRLHGFGTVTGAERRAADAFFATLLGGEIHRAARRRRAAEDAETEDRSLFKDPLDEADWRDVVRGS